MSDNNRKFNNGERRRSSKFDRYDNGGKKPFNNNNDSAPKKKVFISTQIPLGASRDYTDNITGVTELVSQIPFNKISIPVNIKRSVINKEGNGFMNVGFINKFENGTFTVALNESIVDLASKNFSVVPRYKCDKDGNPTYILSFSLEKCRAFESDFNEEDFIENAAD